jgi:hypothetical protein
MDAIAIELQAEAWIAYTNRGGRQPFSQWAREKGLGRTDTDRIRREVERLRGFAP